jgi:hypothetical protein
MIQCLQYCLQCAQYDKCYAASIYFVSSWDKQHLGPFDSIERSCLKRKKSMLVWLRRQDARPESDDWRSLCKLRWSWEHTRDQATAVWRLDKLHRDTGSMLMFNADHLFQTANHYANGKKRCVETFDTLSKVPRQKTLYWGLFQSCSWSHVLFFCGFVMTWTFHKPPN